MLANPERLSKTAERVAEDFCWVQWDVHTQRLYYLTRAVLRRRFEDVRIRRAADVVKI